MALVLDSCDTKSNDILAYSSSIWFIGLLALAYT